MKTQKEKEELIKCPNCLHLMSEHYIYDCNKEQAILVRCSANHTCSCALWLIKNRSMALQFIKLAKQAKTKINKRVIKDFSKEKVELNEPKTYSGTVTSLGL